MKEADLMRILGRLGIREVDPPNTAGWAHSACPFAPWKHRSGVDRSRGFAIKVEDRGTSAYACPACKSHGRIEQLARELGTLRGEDYSQIEREISNIELAGGMLAPSWEERQANAMPERLPEPLDREFYDPKLLFDPVGAHPAAVDFLRRRRVSFDAVQKAEIRFDPDKKRLTFPVYTKDGSLYGFTGRSILSDAERSFIGQDGRPVTLPKVLDYANLPKRMLILGEHRWVPGRPTIIVEGLFAYARFLTEGVDEHYNVGALLGSVLTPGKASILRSWNLPVYLILDPDEAGTVGIFGPSKQIGIDRATGEPILVRDHEHGAIWQLIDHVMVFAPAYPEGVFDPDDLSLQQVLDMCATCAPAIKPRPKGPPKVKRH